MTQDSSDKENTVVIDESTKSKSKSKITIERINKRKPKVTSKIETSYIDENNNTIGQQSNKRKLDHENTNPSSPIKTQPSKRQALTSIENIQVNEALEKNSDEINIKKKLNDTVTLRLTCFADPIHDIILNNIKSSDIRLPPFEARFNMHCVNDDQQVLLSDNIDDLFSYRLAEQEEEEKDLSLLKQVSNNQAEESQLNQSETNLTQILNLIPTCTNDDNSQIETLKRKFEIDSQYNNNVYNVMNETLQTENSFKKIRTQIFDHNDYQIVMNLIKSIFTMDELKVGIFPDKHNANRSKKLVLFHPQKVELLKEEIAKQFDLNQFELNELWYAIRPKLNSRIKSLRKTKAYSQ